MVNVCGNLGALPKPPHFLSACFIMFSKISSTCCFVKISPGRSIDKFFICVFILERPMCCVSSSACASTSCLFSLNNLETPCKTSFHEALLKAFCGGKYVPPYNGF